MKGKEKVGRNRRPRETGLEKVVASKQLRLAVKKEERRARLENDAATKRLRLAMDTDFD